MRARLVRTYLAIALFVLVVLEVPLVVSLAGREYDRLQADVVGDAVVLAAVVEEALEEGRPVRLPGSVAGYVEESNGRIVVVDTDGISVADTGAEVPRDFSTRPEIVEALEGTRSSGRRSSDTLSTELLYVAVPVVSDDGVLGAVRITYPTAIVRAQIVRQLLVLLGVAIVVLAATALVALRLARWAIRPIAEIEDAVERFGDGDLDARAQVTEGPPEVVTLAARIDDMADRIGQLVEAQRGFASDASHQLRTPLTGLRLELENLEMAAPDDATRAGLERAIDGTHRLSRIVDGLLTLTRLEGQRAVLEPVDVRALVDEAVERWRALADEQDVLLTVEVTSDALAVHSVGVHDDLAQVLDVLVDNALAVSAAGSTVRITGTAVDGRAELRVVDAGPGMSAEERERAFERRWQGAAATGGTGLGLAIARRLADASRADLRLEEAPSGGLAAVVTLARS